MGTTRTRLVAAGLGVAVAGGLVVAGPVMSAFAADRPNTLADARKATPTAVNAWVDDEAIGSSKDQDWYHYELTRDAWVTVTLGALPANYTLALYGDDGKVIATSSRSGKTFERITKKLGAGTYFVKVSSASGSSRTPYRLRFRELPRNQVFVLDRTATFKTVSGKKQGRFVATFFNSTTSWQQYTGMEFHPVNAAGDPTGDFWTVPQNRRIAPGGTLVVDWDWHEVGASTTTYVVGPHVQPIGPPVASGLSVKADSSRKVVRHYGRTEYPVVVRNTASVARDYYTYAKHFSTIGNLTDVGEDSGRLGPGKSFKATIWVMSTTKTPNQLVFSVEQWRP